MGYSPKRGEGGSPTFSPFPGERGLGIGIENKHFFEKTNFFTNCYARCHSGRFLLAPLPTAGENPTKFPENCFITLAKVSDFCYNVYRVGIGFDLNFHKKTISI